MPCNYTGGRITVYHQNKKKEFDFGGEEALATFYYAAFYAECHHEIEPVTEGYRLCLIYNLIWKGSPNDIPVPPDHQLNLVAYKIKSTLKKWEKDAGATDSPKMMVCILEHECSSSDGLSFDFLTGIDKSKAEILITAKEGCNFDLFLTRITVSKLCTRDEYGYDDDASFEESVSVDTIVSPDGCRTRVKNISIEEELIFPELDVSYLEPDEIEHGMHKL